MHKRVLSEAADSLVLYDFKKAYLELKLDLQKN